MSDEKSARESWQSSVPEAQPPSLDEVRKSAGKFYRRIWWRNAIEYGAAAIVVVSFSVYVFILPHLFQRIGSVMIVAGTLFAVWQLHRRASAVRPEEAGTMPIMEFVRFQLVRQRDALASVFWWYLLPFIPGMVTFVAGTAAMRAEGGPDEIVKGVIGTGVMLALFAGVWGLNQWGARKLQKHIDDIDALLGAKE